MYEGVYGRSSFTGASTIEDNSLFEADNIHIKLLLLLSLLSVAVNTVGQTSSVHVARATI